MAINTIETKWNADEYKVSLLMNIEEELENAFLNYDCDQIYSLLRSYRRQTNPKFRGKVQEDIKEKLGKLSKKLIEMKKAKDRKGVEEFYQEAEELFLVISQKLKEAGIYYREGRNASNAILERG